jgi:hypothetical protein
MWSNLLAGGLSFLGPAIAPRNTQNLPLQPVERDNTIVFVGVAAALIFLVVIIYIIRKK